jgi:hypothetical protein
LLLLLLGDQSPYRSSDQLRFSCIPEVISLRRSSLIERLTMVKLLSPA